MMNSGTTREKFFVKLFASDRKLFFVFSEVDSISNMLNTYNRHD